MPEQDRGNLPLLTKGVSELIGNQEILVEFLPFLRGFGCPTLVGAFNKQTKHFGVNKVTIKADIQTFGVLGYLSLWKCRRDIQITFKKLFRDCLQAGLIPLSYCLPEWLKVGCFVGIVPFGKIVLCHVIPYRR
ncbi:hypothetical protein ACFOMG_02730 [Bacterioplanoides pacificum]|uniref:Uncharacterized protein n=2 Tax=Bacterioplanoides pacificum TaxID=1171596 RepID=A0ABV7VQ66_9GAMM